jgi:hypothetical protein
MAKLNTKDYTLSRIPRPEELLAEEKKKKQL